MGGESQKHSLASLGLQFLIANIYSKFLCMPGIVLHAFQEQLDYHTSLMRQALLSHLTARELRLLNGKLPAQDFIPENHINRSQTQVGLILEFYSQPLCYVPSLNHFSPHENTETP